MNAPHDDTQDLQVDVPVGFWRRTAYLLGPVAVAGAAVGLVYLLGNLRTMNEVLIAGGASLLGAGTTVVFGKAALGDQLIELSLDTWHLALIVAYVNAASAFFYCYNLDLLRKVPKVGPYMQRSRKNAVGMLRQRPWIRKWAVVGVSLFVITPLPGSGALGGALMGRIIGVSKKAGFVAISIAGVVVSAGYAMLAHELKQLLDKLERFAPAWTRVAVFVLVAIVLIWVMARLVRWFASHPPEEGDAPLAEEPSTGESSAGGTTPA